MTGSINLCFRDKVSAECFSHNVFKGGVPTFNYTIGVIAGVADFSGWLIQPGDCGFWMSDVQGFQAFNIDDRVCYRTASQSGVWKFAFHMDPMILSSKMSKISSNFSGFVCSFLVMRGFSPQEPSSFWRALKSATDFFQVLPPSEASWSQHVTCCDRVLIGLG